MSPVPTLLTLFGGGGGDARGYRRAGYRVIGVDSADHSRAFARIGCEFHQMDWREGLRRWAPGGRHTRLASVPAVQRRISLPAWPGREIPRSGRPRARGAGHVGWPVGH